MDRSALADWTTLGLKIPTKGSAITQLSESVPACVVDKTPADPIENTDSHMMPLTPGAYPTHTTTLENVTASCDKPAADPISSATMSDAEPEGLFDADRYRASVLESGTLMRFDQSSFYCEHGLINPTFPNPVPYKRISMVRPYL